MAADSTISKTVVVLVGIIGDGKLSFIRLDDLLTDILYGFSAPRD